MAVAPCGPAALVREMRTLQQSDRALQKRHARLQGFCSSRGPPISDFQLSHSLPQGCKLFCMLWARSCLQHTLTGFLCLRVSTLPR